MAQQRALVRGVVGIDRDADAGGDHRAGGGRHRRQGGEDPLGQPLGGSVRLRRQDRELVAAEARHQLPGIEQAADPEREVAQHRVAGRVAEQVVDLLETVEVEAQHREPAAQGVGGAHLALEPRVEARAVGEAGERVVVGEIVDLALGPAPGAQVAHRHGVVRQPPVLGDRAHDHLDRDGGAPAGTSSVSRGWSAVPVPDTRSGR